MYIELSKTCKKKAALRQKPWLALSMYANVYIMYMHIFRSVLIKGSSHIELWTLSWFLGCLSVDAIGRELWNLDFRGLMECTVTLHTHPTLRQAVLRYYGIKLMSDGER